jgi:hypothetical protein
VSLLLLQVTRADCVDGPKSGWLRGWFGKKEGEGSGPIVAKLGEESSMVFDPELKRWVVKGVSNPLYLFTAHANL